jgi:hypothetical protein
MDTQPQHDPECGRNGKQDMTMQLQLFSFFVLSTAKLLWKNCGVIHPTQLQMLEMHGAFISKWLTNGIWSYLFQLVILLIKKMNL